MTRKTFTGNESVRDTNNELYYGIVVSDSIVQSNVSVATSATKLPSIPLVRRKFIVIFNNSSAIIYIGDATVTTANGFPLYPTSQLSIAIEDGIDIYAVVGSSTADIRLLEGH